MTSPRVLRSLVPGAGSPGPAHCSPGPPQHPLQCRVPQPCSPLPEGHKPPAFLLLSGLGQQPRLHHLLQLPCKLRSFKPHVLLEVTSMGVTRQTMACTGLGPAGSSSDPGLWPRLPAPFHPHVSSSCSAGMSTPPHFRVLTSRPHTGALSHSPGSSTTGSLHLTHREHTWGHPHWHRVSLGFSFSPAGSTHASYLPQPHLPPFLA